MSGLSIDWGAIAPLALRARTLSEGLYSGVHRSLRKGTGVEFGGQRQYVPGDDLRFFDRRSLLRHDRFMVREFETETDRALWLCVDASASMAYKSKEALGAKFAYAALLSSAMTRVALSSGDPVGLECLGGENTRGTAASSARDVFERITSALEATRAGGDFSSESMLFDRTISMLNRKARRGSIVMVFSDFLDLPRNAAECLMSLTTRGRTLLLIQVLDPAEATLPFDGEACFRSSEGGIRVDADPGLVREAYQERLAADREIWKREVEGRGGRFVALITSDDPAASARIILKAAAGGER